MRILGSQLLLTWSQCATGPHLILLLSSHSVLIFFTSNSPNTQMLSAQSGLIFAAHLWVGLPQQPNQRNLNRWLLFLLILLPCFHLDAIQTKSNQSSKENQQQPSQLILPASHCTLAADGLNATGGWLGGGAAGARSWDRREPLTHRRRRLGKANDF